MIYFNSIVNYTTCTLTRLQYVTLPTIFYQIFLLLVLLAVYSGSEATQQCNLYSFALGPAVQCGQQWWAESDFHTRTDDLDTQATDIIVMVLRNFNVSAEEANIGLNDAFGSSFQNPLQKLVESVMLVEPYLAYAVMDLVEGFDLTAVELGKLGLPADWTEKSKLMNFYESYFQLSCEMQV